MLLYEAQLAMFMVISLGLASNQQVSSCYGDRWQLPANKHG